MSTGKNEYNPDYAVHPGEYLEEVLESREIKKREFAERTGLSVKAVSQILNGKSLYSPEVALVFEKTLGIKAEIWLNLAEAYQLLEARKKDEIRLKTEQTREWVRRFPTADLKRLGCIPDTKKLEIVADSLLRFLGVSDPEAWEDFNLKKSVAYRKSGKFDESPEATAVWLHIAEREAENIETKEFDKGYFQEVLTRIRNRTVLPVTKSFPEAVRFCADAGVALVQVPELKNTYIHGATRWLTQNRAMIAVSGRHKTNDHLWFTIFHEAAHILFHGKKAIFLDSGEPGGESKEEKEADRFAEDMLIPPDAYKSFIEGNAFYPKDIRAFAKAIGAHPGVVAGRLQHDGHIQHYWHNDLKEKCEI